jgi:hypothetical protein
MLRDSGVVHILQGLFRCDIQSDSERKSELSAPVPKRIKVKDGSYATRETDGT